MHHLLNLVLFCRTSSSFGQLSAAPFVNGDMQHFLPVGREWAWNYLSVEIIAGLLIRDKIWETRHLARRHSCPRPVRWVDPG